VILVTGVRPTESSGIVTGVMGLCKKKQKFVFSFGGCLKKLHDNTSHHHTFRLTWCKRTALQEHVTTVTNQKDRDQRSNSNVYERF